MDLDFLRVWTRLPALSVVEAAALFVGEDPEKPLTPKWDWNGQDPNTIRYSKDSFDSIFALFRRAVLTGALPAKLAFPARQGPNSTEVSAKRVVFVDSDAIQYSLQNDVILPFGEGFADEWVDKLVIERAPDWIATTVQTSDLRQWLKSIHMESEVFDVSSQAESSDFHDLLDENHAHYSEELALAVRVWRDLKDQKSFKSSPRAAIKDKAEKLAGTERGQKRKVTREGIERIATLVNWQPQGGAPRS